MRADAILNQMRDIVTVRRVFGEPYERDGVLVVPVAGVRGGGGGGGDDGPDTGGMGWGGGFGVDARPVGVYVINGAGVSWEPAVDVTRIVLQGQVVAIVALLVLGSIARHRRWRD